MLRSRKSTNSPDSLYAVDDPQPGTDIGWKPDCWPSGSTRNVNDAGTVRSRSCCAISVPSLSTKSE